MLLLQKWNFLSLALGAKEVPETGDLLIQTGTKSLRIGRAAAAKNRLSIRARGEDDKITFAPFYDFGTVTKVEQKEQGVIRIVLTSEKSGIKTIDITNQAEYQEVTETVIQSS